MKPFGAVNQIRTGDLVLTKDVLYRLSHNSKPMEKLPVYFSTDFILYRRRTDLSSFFPIFFHADRMRRFAVRYPSSFPVRL